MHTFSARAERGLPMPNERYRGIVVLLLSACAMHLMSPTAAGDDITNAPVPAFIATIAGIAKVKDGDGILFGDVEIRLQGIAAPEDRRGARDPGGQESTANLRALVDGRSVECMLDGTVASSNRPVGICFVDGHDVGLAQVVAGHARDCPAFSRGRYAEAERQARALRVLASIYPLPEYCMGE